MRNIDEKSFSSSKFIERQLHAGYPTKLLTIDDAISFLMVLPGEIAKSTRAQFANIIRKYFGGDKTLIAEINANATSNSPIAQMARGGMGAPAEDEVVMVGFKRRREELELFKLEAEIKGMEQARITSLKKELELISDPTSSKLDERTRLLFKDTYMNMLITPQITSASAQQAQIGNEPSENKPISISSVAVSLGYKASSADSQRIGIDLKKRYFKKHNKPPSKHEQLCDGRVTLVNSYTEKDKGLVIDALHAYFGSA